MKRQWETEELIEHWTLNVEELVLLGNKTGATKLGFAVLLKFFQKEARSPAYKNEVPGIVITYLATQARVPAEAYLQYDWQGCSIKEHRTQVREAVKAWLVERALPQELQEERLREIVSQRYRDLKIEAPAPNRILRQIRSARYTFEQQFYETITAKLPAATRAAKESRLIHRTYTSLPSSALLEQMRGREDILQGGQQ